MFQIEIFIFKLSSINALASCTITACKITSLYHESLDYAMEYASFELECLASGTHTFFTGAQSSEIFGSLWNHIRK